MIHKIHFKSAKNTLKVSKNQKHCVSFHSLLSFSVFESITNAPEERLSRQARFIKTLAFVASAVGIVWMKHLDELFGWSSPHWRVERCWRGRQEADTQSGKLSWVHLMLSPQYVLHYIYNAFPPFPILTCDLVMRQILENKCVLGMRKSHVVLTKILSGKRLGEHDLCCCDFFPPINENGAPPMQTSGSPSTTSSVLMHLCWWPKAAGVEGHPMSRKDLNN